MSQTYHAGRAMKMRGRVVAVGDVVDVEGWPEAALEHYCGRGYLVGPKGEPLRYVRPEPAKAPAKAKAKTANGDESEEG